MTALITLSFDNGPDPEATPYVLKVLASRDVQATFFVVGEKLRDRRYLSEQVHAQGHWIGNHTFNHLVPLGLTAEPGFASTEIARTQDLIGDLAHKRRYFRPSGGGGLLDKRLLNAEAFAYLQAERYTCVLWNVLPEDWAFPETWVERALKLCLARDESLVVLHDLPTGAMKHLGRFIDEARANGAVFRQDFPAECLLTETGTLVNDAQPFINDLPLVRI